MTDPDSKDTKVKIHPPDRSLHAKIGGVPFEHAVSPQAIKAAQDVIMNAASQFLVESMKQIEDMSQANNTLQRMTSDDGRLLGKIIDNAFSIKTKTSVNGYYLVAALAKSLQIICEQMDGQKLSERDLDLIQWHISSIQMLMKGKLKGDGGETGAAILAQLERLAPHDSIVNSEMVLNGED